jgi:hypothetical protein
MCETWQAVGGGREGGENQRFHFVFHGSRELVIPHEFGWQPRIFQGLTSLSAVTGAKEGRGDNGSDDGNGGGGNDSRDDGHGLCGGNDDVMVAII